MRTLTNLKQMQLHFKQVYNSTNLHESHIYRVKFLTNLIKEMPGI